MLLVRLAFSALAILPLSGAQTINVVQPDTPGLQLVGSQSPDFQAAAARVVSPQTLQEIAAYIPFAVVLENTSPQPLADYRIRWTYEPVPNGTAGGESTGLYAPQNPAGYLQPGAAVLAVPGSVLTGDPGPEYLQAMQRKQSDELSGWQRAKAIGISLDSAIFSSGQFVGPDTENNFSLDAAYFTAWRSVDSDVQAQLAAGAPFDQIAAYLERIKDQPVAGTSKVTRDWTAQAQATEARQLLMLYQRRGSQAVGNLVSQQLQVPEIVVHR